MCGARTSLCFRREVSEVIRASARARALNETEISVTQGGGE